MEKPIRITRLTLKNFKSIKEQAYDFGQFDLLVGRNNGGKSTVLQALAIWQFCVDLFHQSSRSGSKGIQVVLPNFTALPVPEFNLLWKDKTDRSYPVVDGKKTQQFILIQISVEWRYDTCEKTEEFGIDLRYHSPQTIYAIPSGGWEKFRDYEIRGMPKIAYIPPFSGLDPAEKWLDISPIRQQVGKGQPGSVLRNLLLRVCAPSGHGGDGGTVKRDGSEWGDGSGSGSGSGDGSGWGDGSGGRPSKRREPSPDWQELAKMIKLWFSVDIHEPEYNSSRDVYIRVEYRQNDKNYDVISGGSGFHQTLTLLAFLYGYKPTTILIDEPDAHLHASLQQEVLDFFSRKSNEKGTQFLIATHAEKFMQGVDTSQIVSLLDQTPKRIRSTPQIVRAMAEVSNVEIERLMLSPFILYVEGASDERMLRAWVDQCGGESIISKFFFKTMNGGNKKEMMERANSHYEALRQIISNVSRLILFDYDSDSTYHPESGNLGLAEWPRKNIENYLLVPKAWKRAAQKKVGPLFATHLLSVIDDFFAEQNLNLPPNKTWRNVTANVFSVVDGKRILFENDDSLFHQLQNMDPSVTLPRQDIAVGMMADEIHDDVHFFFKRLLKLVGIP